MVLWTLSCIGLPKVYFYKYTVFTRSKECLTIRRSIVHATCEAFVRRGLYLEAFKSSSLPKFTGYSHHLVRRHKKKCTLSFHANICIDKSLLTYYPLCTNFTTSHYFCIVMKNTLKCDVTLFASFTAYKHIFQLCSVCFPSSNQSDLKARSFSCMINGIALTPRHPQPGRNWNAWFFFQRYRYQVCH